ncbi:Meiotically up-regulated protein 86 protein [Malassezia equina]|uniref:Meiotically up-regulated protein 86 protein n=1 Tax=Malassezia equina TaxID=1381935 RepID=A0AAF0J4Z9_9BASI|nr:Meiotically up-regulated protein 86 protein [Malassezia equina]
MEEQYNRAFGGEFQPGIHLSKDRKQPNPAPLGLCGMAMCNFLLALINMGTRGLSIPTVLISTGFVYGGLIQILAGMWEMAIGNTFGATTLASYGAYWISYAIIQTPGGFHIMDTLVKEEGMSGYLNTLGLFEVGWFIFTTIMTFMTTKSTVAFFSLFVALDLTYLFAGLAFLSNDGSNPNKTLLRIDGAFGIITAFLAWYNAYSGIADQTNSFFTTPVIHFPWSAEAPFFISSGHRLSHAGNSTRYLTSSLQLSSKKDEAASFSLYDNGNGQGHSIQELSSHKYVQLSSQGNVSLSSREDARFIVASVSL